MWGEQWECQCGWSNITLRTKCRNCGEPQPADAVIETPFGVMAKVERMNDEAALARRVAEKAREIAATGLCQWGYRTAADIDQDEEQ